jgi:hypothetical protein
VRAFSVLFHLSAFIIQILAEFTESLALKCMVLTSVFQRIKKSATEFV